MSAWLDARLRDLVAALVRYLQRVLPIMDARDRMATAGEHEMPVQQRVARLEEGEYIGVVHGGGA